MKVILVLKQIKENNVRFEVFITVTVKSTVFWMLMPYSLVHFYQYFRGIYSLIQGWQLFYSSYSSAMKVDTVHSTEISGNLY